MRLWQRATSLVTFAFCLAGALAAGSSLSACGGAAVSVEALSPGTPLPADEYVELADLLVRNPSW